MTQIISLAPAESVAGRDFADPARSHDDLAQLEHMRAGLAALLGEAGLALGAAPASEPQIAYLSEAGGRQHRAVVAARQRLLAAPELTVVGFFGQRRAEADPNMLGAIDAELLGEFVQHEYVLSYSSIELPGGDWGNLVLLEHAAGIEHWRASQRHIYAARELSPQFYASIRLHNGRLPGGLRAPAIELTSTKYYDFRQGWWQALRLASYREP